MTYKLSAFTALFVLCSPITQANNDIYLSLFFVEQSKGMNDFVLLTDGRTLSIKKGKVRAPDVYVITEWNKFNEASYLPPKSSVILQIVEFDQKASVCFKDKCQLINAVCPRIQLLKTGKHMCTSFPSLAIIKQEQQ
jgi:hypothetical protein